MTERKGYPELVGDTTVVTIYSKEEFDTEWIENTSVTPVDETGEWTKQDEASFQPALETVERMHHSDLGVRYSD